jgi:hypothetical protein
VRPYIQIYIAARPKVIFFTFFTKKWILPMASCIFMYGRKVQNMPVGRFLLLKTLKSSQERLLKDVSNITNHILIQHPLLRDDAGAFVYGGDFFGHAAGKKARA